MTNNAEIKIWKARTAEWGKRVETERWRCNEISGNMLLGGFGAVCLFYKEDACGKWNGNSSCFVCGNWEGEVFVDSIGASHFRISGWLAGSELTRK